MEWLTSAEVAARLRVSRSTLYDWMSRYDFPKPLRHGGKRRWVASEVECWIDAQSAARNA